MRIGLISCVKTKISTQKPVRADNLYKSDLFKKSYKYCTLQYDKVFILSAKYGLLNIYDKVLPYEKTLNTMSKKEKEVWYNNVCFCLKKTIQEEDTLHFHCGQNYRSGLISRLKNTYEVPLLGLSFGNQLKFYKVHLSNQKTLF
jgi:cytoplasmic iron level regulating protein YaaA (DUF328/UPF0246 family)